MFEVLVDKHLLRQQSFIVGHAFENNLSPHTDNKFGGLLFQDLGDTSELNT